MDKLIIKLWDLDWDDRERVLRLLFSKMNSGMICPNWRNPHTTNTQQMIEEELGLETLNEAQEYEYKPWSGRSDDQ